MPFRIERRTTGKASLSAVDPSQRRESTQDEEPERAGVADLIESPGAFAISRRANRDRRPSNDDLQWPLPEEGSDTPDPEPEPDPEQPPMDADVSTPSRRSRRSGRSEESLQDSSSDASERSDEAQMGPNPGYVVLGTSKSPRQKWLLIGFVGALVVFGGIIVGLVVALTARSGNSADEPEEYISCRDLKPLTVSSEIENFDALADELGINASPTITSCTPANEALLFVSQDFDSLTPVSRLNRFVLSTLFGSLSGSAWKGSDWANWMSSKSECVWEGVTCQDGSVTEIRINNNREAKGRLPTELGMLKSLEVLELSECELSGEIPSTLDKLMNLARVNVESNQMTGAPLPMLTEMTWIKELRLKKNALTGTIPMLAGMTQLEVLELAENQFNGTIPYDISEMKSLSTLDIRSNGNIVGGIPNSIGAVTSLTSINLSFNQLNGTIPESLYELVGLVHFEVEETELTGTLATDLGKLTKLTALIIAKSYVHGTIPSEIGLLTKLRRLALYEQDLQGTIPTTFVQLTDLEELQLFRTDITGSIPSGLCKHGRLAHVPLDVECPHGCCDKG